MIPRKIVVARLSKAKSTTHDFAQAIMKKLLKQKINYPISYCVVSAAGTVCRGFCLTSLVLLFERDHQNFIKKARKICPGAEGAFKWTSFWTASKKKKRRIKFDENLMKEIKYTVFLNENEKYTKK